MSVTAAKGFEAAGVSAGIRPSGKPDVALAVGERVKITVRQTIFSLVVNFITAIGTALVLGLGAHHVLTAKQLHYPPGSLKARLCRAGGVEHRQKVVIAGVRHFCGFTLRLEIHQGLKVA